MTWPKATKHCVIGGRRDLESVPIRRRIEVPTIGKPVNDSSLKVFVCDPQPASVFGIEHALADVGITVVGTAGDPSSCLAQADTEGPLVYIVDQFLADAFDARIVRGLLEADRTRRVVAYSGHDDVFMVASAYQAGASAFVSKRAPLRALLDVIQAVHRHSSARERHFPGQVAEVLSNYFIEVARAGASPRNVLSARQFEIYLLIAKGLSTREIADELKIARRSVGNQMVMIRKILGIPTKQIRSHAIKHGLISPLQRNWADQGLWRGG